MAGSTTRAMEIACGAIRHALNTHWICSSPVLENEKKLKQRIDAKTLEQAPRVLMASSGRRNYVSAIPRCRSWGSPVLSIQTK